MLHKIINYFKEAEYRHRDRCQQVARLIGEFYLAQDNNSYVEASKSIQMLGITKIDVMGNKITITLTRPGILIGRRGENIDALTAYLSRYLEDTITINIIEERVTPCLFPYEPYSMDDIDNAVEGI